eukprot:4518756-Amphidinium_carterae.1
MGAVALRRGVRREEWCQIRGTEMEAQRGLASSDAAAAPSAACDAPSVEGFPNSKPRPANPLRIFSSFLQLSGLRSKSSL